MRLYHQPMPLPAPHAPLPYLALGDSYTICTGAGSPAHRWPNIVARRLQEHLGRDVDVTNAGVDGYTTSDLITHELPYLHAAAWEYISVLIGVNDFFQGVDEPLYRTHMVRIYDAIAVLPAAHVL